MAKKEKEIKEKSNPLLTFIPYLILIISLFYIYARYLGVRGIVVRDYSVTNSKIPESFDGFSIVQFSDMKLGSTFNIENLDSLVEKINKRKPDVVVFTGDIIAKGTKINNKQKEEIISKLSKIDPLIGKYSVKGDEDYRSDYYNSIMVNSGFKDLTNNYELIYYKGLTPIVIYGIGSLNKKDIDLPKAFSYPNKDVDTNYMATYRILLSHEPDSIDKVKNYNISLMLSGHSLNSSINIPFFKDRYNIKGATKYFDEKYTVDKTKLYISSGLGSNSYKLRFNSKPSISIFRLYTK